MFKKMKIGAKLIIGFLTVALIAGIIGGFGVININKLDSSDTFLYEGMTVPITYLLNITEYFQRIRVNMHKVLLSETLEEMTQYFEKINTYSDEIVKNADLFEKTIVTDQAKQEFKDFVASRVDYREHLTEIENLAKNNQIEEAKLIANKAGADAAQVEQVAIKKLVDNKIALANKTSEDNSKQANMVSTIMIAVAVIGVMISLILGIFLSLSITRPVQEATRLATSIAEGDLNLVVPEIYLKRGDEIGDLSKEYKNMINTLKEKSDVVERIAENDLTVEPRIASDKDVLGKSLVMMVSSLSDSMAQVNSAVEQTASGSNQVAQASQSLSQGATEQASSLEEITSSITEISSQAKQNAENAIQASGLAKQAMDNAESGNKQMQELVVAMSDINKSADMIKKIVKVIDDIAFQTNLLALNANVEAARAGKYGKGFAVVAEEVRNLASRSAESVQETTQMVEEAIKNITVGNGLVDVTAKQLSEIMEGANKVADLVVEISTASREQTQGLDQITQGLGQIDQVTQSNTANAEESASAAEELAGQAQQLKAIVARFKLSEKNLRYIEERANETSHMMKKIKEDIRIEEPTSHKKLHEMNEKLKDLNVSKGVVKKGVLASPKDVIKLDDDDFGKF